MIMFIVIGIVYYIASTLLCLHLFEKSKLFILTDFQVIMMFIPIVRIIYIIYSEWL